MWCTGCFKHKPEDSFVTTTPKAKCTECRNLYYKEWRVANKEEARCKQLQNKYGVTLEEYNELINSVGYCEICGKDTTLVYDHNHDTGKFRGVLCSLCNSGLGYFKDSKTHLIKAIEYLKERGSYGKN